MSYQRRIVDDLLDEVHPHLAAIALEGAKGVGKTATALQRARTVINAADPRHREILLTDLDRITQVPTPVLLDEWQLYPPVWDRVKQAVDEDLTGGRFLLTGSARVPPGVRIHSGAGRIVSLAMRPMALSERGLLAPTISLAAFFDPAPPTMSAESPVDLATYVDEIVGSGLPGIRGLPGSARRAQLDSYLTRLFDQELAEQGIPVRKPAAMRAWLRAYAAATSTDATYSTILNAATPGETDKPARQTVEVYRQHLTRMFVLDPLPAWTPAFTPLRRLVGAPKHHLADPALAARLVDIDATAMLSGMGQPLAGSGTWLGALFESLATLCVRVYAGAHHWSVGHLRTRATDHEIDLIVEGPGHRVLAIEVKLASVIDDHDVRHLNWLAEQLGDRLADRVVVTPGKYAYRRRDGVAVVPLALLGP